MKHIPPPFFFPESSLFLSVRWTVNPACCMGRDRISGESPVSMKPSMLQSPMSLWKEIFTLSLSTLLSRYWRLASNILGSGGWCVRLLSRTRRPNTSSPPAASWRSLWDKFNCLGGVRTKDPIQENRNAGEHWWVTANLISKHSYH